MSKFNLTSLISGSCLMSLIVVGCLNAPAKSATATVRLTTEPALSKIVPYEAEATTPQQAVKLRLQAIDPTGKPLPNVRMQVKLLTPPSNPWFTTDFPIVEGTELLNLQADASTGKIELQQMLPIRGDYQLQVTTTPIGGTGGEPSQQTIPLVVPENSIKYQNFAILALILAAAGVGGGWVIGARQSTKDGEIAPQPVRLLLSGASLIAIAALLYVNLSAELAQSGMSEPMSHQMGGKTGQGMNGAGMSHAGMGHDEGSKPASTTPANNVVSQGINLAITGDKNATVGKSANFQVKATTAKTNQPIAGTVSIKITNTEKLDKWTAFGYQGAIDSNGKLAWQSGLFDGSGHQVDVEFTPKVAGQNSTPIKVSQLVEVEGVAPPLHVRLISLGYMTGIVATTFILGFWLHRRRDNRLAVI